MLQSLHWVDVVVGVAIVWNQGAAHVAIAAQFNLVGVHHVDWGQVGRAFMLHDDMMLIVGSGSELGIDIIVEDHVVVLQLEVNSVRVASRAAHAVLPIGVVKTIVLDQVHHVVVTMEVGMDVHEVRMLVQVRIVHVWIVAWHVHVHGRHWVDVDWINVDWVKAHWIVMQGVVMHGVVMQGVVMQGVMTKNAIVAQHAVMADSRGDRCVIMLNDWSCGHMVLDCRGNWSVVMVDNGCSRHVILKDWGNWCVIMIDCRRNWCVVLIDRRGGWHMVFVDWGNRSMVVIN